MPILGHCFSTRAACVERLLQEPTVVETINHRGQSHRTALLSGCAADAASGDSRASERFRIVEMLLLAGADPLLIDFSHRTPLDVLQKENPNNHAAIALLEYATATMSPHGYLLTKARHILAAHHALTQATPSFLRPRMPPLPRVELVAAPYSDNQDDDDQDKKKEEETRMAVLRHVLGLSTEGPLGGLLDVHFTELIRLMRPAPLVDSPSVDDPLSFLRRLRL